MVCLIEILNGTHETVTYRSMSGVRAFVNRDAEDFPLHWHTALEIIRPVENEYTVKTNGKTVTFYPGDILLIPPGELHALFAPADGERPPEAPGVLPKGALGDVAAPEENEKEER